MLKEHVLNIWNVIKVLKTAYNTKKDPTDSQCHQICEFSLKMKKNDLIFYLFFKQNPNVQILVLFEL